MRMRWTAQRIEALTRLWQSGVSATDIGVELGLTRGAVLGKLHRLGISDRLRRGPRSGGEIVNLPGKRLL